MCWSWQCWRVYVVRDSYICSTTARTHNWQVAGRGEERSETRREWKTYGKHCTECALVVVIRRSVFCWSNKVYCIMPMPPSFGCSPFLVKSADPWKSQRRTDDMPVQNVLDIHIHIATLPLPPPLLPPPPPQYPSHLRPFNKRCTNELAAHRICEVDDDDDMDCCKHKNDRHTHMYIQWRGFVGIWRVADIGTWAECSNQRFGCRRRLLFAAKCGSMNHISKWM